MNNMKKEQLRLYAVTDRTWLGNETLYEQVEKALEGGVTLVQLREKELPEADVQKEAEELSIRIRDKGEPGLNGGPRGDLMVEVIVARHPIFQRQDMNIFSTAPITYAQAALGGEVRISTVDGDVMYDVKPGTQTDTKVRLKGKGVPSLRNKNVRGDHYVTLVVQVPTKLNEEAKEALRKFDEACGNRPSTGEKKKKFGEKLKQDIKDMFDN